MAYLWYILFFAERCVCRLAGDPMVDTYDHMTMLVVGNKKYTLSKCMKDPLDPCGFNIEIKVGALLRKDRIKYALTSPRYLDISILGARIRMAQNHRFMVSKLMRPCVPEASVKSNDKLLHPTDTVITCPCIWYPASDIEPWKWPIFSRRRFQKHFLEWICLNVWSGEHVLLSELILDRELGPSGVSPNQSSRWKHAFSLLKHV